MLRVQLLAVAMLFSIYSSTGHSANIVLGQSCALSGPTKFLGTEMNKGAKAYFSGVSFEKLLV